MASAAKAPLPWRASYSSCAIPTLCARKSVNRGPWWHAMQLPTPPCVSSSGEGGEAVGSARKIFRPASWFVANSKRRNGIGKGRG